MRFKCKRMGHRNAHLTGGLKMDRIPYITANSTEILWQVYASPAELYQGGYYPTVNANDTFVIWRR